MKVIAIPEYCLGCGLCRIHCAAGHDGYQDNILKAYKRGTPAPRANLVQTQPDCWLNTCRHCVDAPCVNACLTGAMQKDEKGIVFVDANRCVSCYTCMMVCPYGHIQPYPQGSRVIKCDLCRDRKGEPACVAHCPNGALQLVDGREEQP